MRRRRLRGLATAVATLGAALLAYNAGFGGGASTALSSTPVPVVDRAAFADQGVLAFISMGRLWVLDGAGGTLRAVTPPARTASDPWFSPDGRRLSFVLGARTWVAAADGAGARPVAAGPAGGDPWLPDGRLVAGGALWRISSAGVVTRDGPVPQGLAGWSADGSRYVFFTDSLTVRQGRSSSGVERLEVAGSLTGPRTTWFETRVSFTPASGLQGLYLDDAVVLPGREGVLFRLDPDGSDSLIADGLDLYEITAPGERPTKLGILVGLPITVGSGGAFAITNGPDRYAWLTKTVERCSAASATCMPVPAARGVLSLDPAWSPDGRELAFVEAPSSGIANFRQPTVRRWYAAHTLWTIPHDGARATEIAAAGGASAPVWSDNGHSLIYEARDALWLLPILASPPVRIATPLFAPGRWPSYYGLIDWSGQFAWSTTAASGGLARSSATPRR